MRDKVSEFTGDMDERKKIMIYSLLSILITYLLSNINIYLLSITTVYLSSTTTSYLLSTTATYLLTYYTFTTNDYLLPTIYLLCFLFYVSHYCKSQRVLSLISFVFLRLMTLPFKETFDSPSNFNYLSSFSFLISQLANLFSLNMYFVKAFLVCVQKNDKINVRQ